MPQEQERRRGAVAPGSVCGHLFQGCPSGEFRMGQYHRHTRLTRRKQPALPLLREQGWTLERLAKHLDRPYNEVRRVLYGETRPSTYMRSRLVEMTGRRIDELLDEGSLPPKRASERCDCDRCTLARARRAEAAGVVL